MRWLGLVLVLGVVQAAEGEEPAAEGTAAVGEALAAEAAAVLALRTLEDSCARIARGSLQDRAAAIRRTADAWEQVDRAYAAHPEPYLLYWRGVLAGCLEEREESTQDLQAFVATADRTVYPGMLKDARRRLRRLGAAIDTAPPPPTTGPLLAATGALAGAGLGTLAISGGLRAQQVAAVDELQGVVHTRAQIDELDAAVVGFDRASVGTGLAAAALGLASVGTGIVALATGGRAPAVAVAPSEGAWS